MKPLDRTAPRALPGARKRAQKPAGCDHRKARVVEEHARWTLWRCPACGKLLRLPTDTREYVFDGWTDPQDLYAYVHSRGELETQQQQRQATCRHRRGMRRRQDLAVEECLRCGILMATPWKEKRR